MVSSKYDDQEFALVICNQLVLRANKELVVLYLVGILLIFTHTIVDFQRKNNLCPEIDHVASDTVQIRLYWKTDNSLKNTLVLQRNGGVNDINGQDPKAISDA